MAIDTAAKRRSSAASRRMPWMRRFGIAPDGTIGQADRTSGVWVYSGILPSTAPPAGGWTAGDRSHLFVAENRSHLLTAGNRSHLWIADDR